MCWCDYAGRMTSRTARPKMPSDLVLARAASIFAAFANEGRLRAVVALAHNGPMEPGGERLNQAVIGWLAQPRGRKVVEVEAMGPEEGVGREERLGRRGSRVRSNSRFGAR